MRWIVLHTENGNELYINLAQVESMEIRYGLTRLYFTGIEPRWSTVKESPTEILARADIEYAR